jgi:hypothetical protein
MLLSTDSKMILKCSLTLKIEDVYSLEMLENYQTTQRHILEKSTLQSDHCENLE